MTAILVVINDHLDPRRKFFGELFVKVGADVFFTYCTSTIWIKLDAFGELGQPLTELQIPTRVDAVLVHGSDFETCWSPIGKPFVDDNTKLFVFDAPGNPAPRKGAIKILRATNPFELTSRHAEEICHFATKDAKSDCSPSCCWREAQQLSAIDILCQGWLIAHGELHQGDGRILHAEATGKIKSATDSTDWWLRGLHMSSFDKIQEELIEEGVPGASAENVVTLLRRVASAGGASATAVNQLRTATRELLL